ncbi:MAG: SUMF1/EgtB/PvdO family nonheme iron enzyme [Burkholderiales bacterium]|nr:SUMF1/EgtB/PvdO family nonheme iron enzyme [Burkholderiales bacterium]
MIPSTALESTGAARRADAARLSLALIEARNLTLAWLAAFEASAHGAGAPLAAGPGAAWRIGHAAWWTDHWIVRHVHAQRGERGDAARPRLAPADPVCAAAFDPARRVYAAAGALELPPPAALRAYLADTLEAALELLARAAADDDALHFHRLALLHEDRLGETLAALAQSAGLEEGPWPPAAPARAQRAPLWLPAQRFMLGAEPGGVVPGAERWAHEVAIPEFEIDAQPVNWARLAEFAEDGAYDEPRWWTPAGWAWAQTVERRAPRDVEQLRHGVVRLARGRLQRAAAAQAVANVTRHEAEAWCRWAGRRLPTEPEWELAACRAASRGFVWGDVLEWVAGRARPWPGHAPVAGDPDPLVPGAAVLRGASSATPRRSAHPRARRFVADTDDLWPCGFRSCAA